MVKDSYGVIKKISRKMLLYFYVLQFGRHLSDFFIIYIFIVNIVYVFFAKYQTPRTLLSYERQNTFKLQLISPQKYLNTRSNRGLVHFEERHVIFRPLCRECTKPTFYGQVNLCLYKRGTLKMEINDYY